MEWTAWECDSSPSARSLRALPRVLLRWVSPPGLLPRLHHALDPSSSPTSVPQPTLVTLDFGGTLALERTSRSGIYAEVAEAEGLGVPAQAMGQLMAGAARDLRGCPHFRYTIPWFEAFIEGVFVRELGLPEARLPAVQAELLERFADPSTFELLPGARGLVEALVAAGIRLAIVSNWSPALPGLVEGLGVSEHVEATFVSAIEELEKPDPRFYEHALERLNVPPSQALHVGNEVENDGRAARAAGLEVLLVHAGDPGEFPHAASLQEATARILTMR